MKNKPATSLKVPGVAQPAREVELTPAGRTILKVETRHAIAMDAVRAAGTPPVEVETPVENDIIEVELEGGLCLVTSWEEFQQRHPGAAARDAATGETTFPTALNVGGPTRGAAQWVIKGLRILGVELEPEFSGKVRLAVEKLEQWLVPRTGLHRFCNPAEFGLEHIEGEVRTEDPKAKEREPLLVFIHGTASSTKGSFGALWPAGPKDPPAPQAPEVAAVLQELARAYAGRMFAFEHHTLTQSPVANALALANQLPARAELHLVSHSRGGMIGELLCRASVPEEVEPIQPVDLAVLKRAAEGAAGDLREAREQQVKELAQLNAVLREKRFKVTRFVRVACPARGTTLAAERLDTWLSIVVHLVGLVPGLKLSPVYHFLSDLLLLVAKERTRPESLPGLEAMMPDSPLVKVLNRPNLEVPADLSVIAGDIEERSLLGKLKLLLPDLFYGGDHDLVVDTRSMYGGARRPEGEARFFFDQGPEVSHFHYFRNPKTATQVLAGLTRKGDKFKAFQPLGLPAPEAPAPAPRRDGRPQPVVVVVPGIMGTHLKVGGNRIWMDPFDLALGGMKKLRFDARGVEPEALMRQAYGEIMDYLAHTHEVVAFPYDWRKSIRDEARRLAEVVGKALEQADRAGQPVRVLAHSMGGLVTRTMFASFPDLWTRLTRHPGGRFVMLGTPNGGSYTIPRILVGQEKTVRQLALLDFTQSQEDLLKIISAFPGVLEMLPADAAGDFYSQTFWNDLATRAGEGRGWVAPPKEALDAARATRELLGQNPPQSDRILYVAGCAPVTPVAMEISASGGKPEIIFQGSRLGDGRVPWKTGIPTNVRTWFMEDVVHGDLAAHPPAFLAILELLQTGATARLSATQPVVERGAERPVVMAPDRVDVYPDEEDFARTLSGGRPRRRGAAKRPKTRVAIAHGNLAYARHPILVGHYIGDGIVSAEAYLDRALGGRLRKRQMLGLYPGPLETVEVIVQADPQRRPAGAIVVGLGRAGELTPNALFHTIARAVLRYALAVAERRTEGRGPVADLPASAKLSALLVGSGAGALTVQDSVLAILRGVRRAILRLEERKLLSDVTIDEVEFVELFEDRALEAANALELVSKDRDLEDIFACDARLRSLDGGRRRATFEEDRGWWHRLQILAQKDGSLKYVAMTRKARAEQSLLPTQRALVDQFILQAISQTLTNTEVARTLFEQLVPNYLKEQAADRADLVLVLDEAAAAYPWELLEDRYSPSNTPMAVQAGLLRQLQTEEFRPQVARTTRKGALVIGEPQDTGQAPLPGAEAEADTVAEALRRNQWEVTSCIKDSAQVIVRALHADSYRVLHLAGHGVHEHPLKPGVERCALCQQPVAGEEQRISGMVIGEGIFLTPADVEQMRRVPDLVFINCCHLGQMRSSPETQAARPPAWNKLAANLAAQFIRMGVKAVIAAGWAVDDQAAGTFARKFYDLMLAGTPFGRAVHGARSEAFTRHPGINTWGAYQCYGDPDFRLVADASQSPTAAGEEQFHSATELAVALEELVSRADNADADAAKRLEQRLDQLAAKAADDWPGSATVLARLAEAWAEFRHFDKAVDCLGRALQCEKAELPIRALEQMCNHQSRWAVECSRRKQDAGTPPVKLIAEASKRLEGLLALGETKERLNLLAATQKRLAWVCEGAARSRALAAMKRRYAQAAELARQGGGQPDHYAECNLAVAKLLCASLGSEPLRPALETAQREVATAKTLALATHAERPDFWTSFALAECDLVYHLAAPIPTAEKAPAGDKSKSKPDKAPGVQNLNQPDILEAILKQYREARELAGSPRKLASVADQLDFLIEILGGLSAQSPLRQQVPALLKVRATLP